MQTRSKTQETINEAAETLLDLYHSKPAPSVNRSLQYHPVAWKRATKIAKESKHGDTILVDFWITYENEKPGLTVLQYLENCDGKIHHRHIEAPYDEITIDWTYQVTDNPFRTD